MRLNSTKLLLVGAFALMASLSFAQVVEPTDSTKVEQDENVSLGETLIIGKGVIDVAENRKTPVANTIITKEEIQDKAVGNVEFPEIMKNSPSVYVADQASGFGDAKMFLRGFDQSNTAYLLNGQPINGMEDGNVYWSNWSSMTDVANVIDVQRGLGSSKLAISSVGGTVNIVTKATELRQGGFVRYVAGNDSYQKATVGYNTGMKGKWGASILLDYWTAHRKYARGTGGEGQSYFVSVGYKPNDRHQFNWMLFGAPQEHDQNYSKPLTTTYNKNGSVNTPGYDMTGRKGNSNYGFYNGEPLSLRTNYYHKPVTNLNWDWTINENASLSTVLYASMGRGGGTGNLGRGLFSLSQDGYNVFTQDGAINWNEVERYNKTIDGGIGSGTSSSSSKGMVLRASVNNHLWYGGVTNFNYDTKTGWAFNVGADVRFYEGDHFQQVVNYLGLNGRQENNKNRSNNLITNTYKAKPWASLFNSADKEDRVNYDNSEKINYQGGFGQVEYSNDIFSAFVQGAISNQSYQKFDRWNYNADHKDVVSGVVSYKNGEAKSKVRNKTGWNIKGGIALNITQENKIFVNAGKYSRQAFLDNVFMQNTVSFIDPAIDNEEILGLEAGYKYMTRNLNVNINAYYTKWENRADSYTANGYYVGEDFVQQDVRFLLTGITQLHKGIEIDFNTKVNRDWTIRGYASYGDWKYDGNANYRIQDQNSSSIVIDNKPVNLDGVKVGNAAQFTFGMGTKVNVAKGLSFDTDFNYFARLYENVNVVDIVKSELKGNDYLNVPLRPYAIVDLGATYEFKFGSQKIRFRGNIKNLFNDQYLSRKDGYGYFWGLGRTWNAGVTYNF
ncbi:MULTISPECIES: TonB-dependent receptor [Empedobacter]|uniref:TonB-dependent receptor n=1 Tax=Empedobacter TaxID=59734 RepID=UPI001CE079DE|nr:MULTISPECIES: TonB-dependent receptor plug domain-containing protein [Empedobacter]MCA4775493.1 TonB-dependent receptor plug domain-containing protein [Empedobacter stercoris]